MPGVLGQYGHPTHTHPGVRRLRTATTRKAGTPSSSLWRRTSLPFKRQMHHMDTQSMANAEITSLMTKREQTEQASNTI
eukprot:1022952-Amphidinium_carterae.1